MVLLIGQESCQQESCQSMESSVNLNTGQRCSFADRSWRKSLIFQLLVILEQAKCLKDLKLNLEEVKVLSEFLKFITAYQHYSRSDFGGQFNGTICL